MSPPLPSSMNVLMYFVLVVPELVLKYCWCCMEATLPEQQVEATPMPEPEPEPEVGAAVATSVTPVNFRRYNVAPGGRESTPAGELVVKLVHVASPEDGRFSRSKKQCDLWVGELPKGL